MSRYNIFFTCFFLFFSLSKNIGQSLGFNLQHGVSRVDIPFQLVNNLIIVDIIFHQTLPVKFIFDTGAEHTILCKKELAEIMGLPYNRTFKILGADMRTELTAHLLRQVSLKVKNTYIEAPQQDILVLEDDYFKLDEASGEKISGILGADMFNRYVVKINYVKKIISLYDSEKFVPPSDFEYFDLNIKSGKPYFYPNVFIEKKDSIPLRILLDTGSLLPMLLFTNTHSSLKLPSQYIRGSIGIGLGGNVIGYVGKVNQVKISTTIGFDDLPCHFQDIDMVLDSTSAKTRNGIIGEPILSRFTIYIDYVREKLYLQPNHFYKKEIRFDRSGLNLIAVGADLDQFLVQNIVPNSPAAWADFRKNDEIVSVNYIAANFYSLQDLSELFKRKGNKKMRVVMKRHGRRYVKYLRLKDLI
jgi:predicted aspartyl protease